MHKWEKIEVDKHVPKGAILHIAGYLWKVMRRKGFTLYIKEYKPIIIRKK